MKSTGIILLVLVLSNGMSLAATYTVAAGCTSATCNWNVGTSWAGGVVPLSNAASGSIINIPAGIGINITGPTSYANLITVNNNGNTKITDSGAKLILENIASTINTGPGSSFDGSGASNIVEIGKGSNKTNIQGNQIDQLSDGPNTFNIDNLNGGGCVVTGCIVVLPIKLIHFKGYALLKLSVKLDWSTASEENFSYFELARSTDGTNFELFGTIKSKGSNTTIKQEYSFEDKSPYNGINYYQLTSVDFDGYRETFDMIAVQVNQTLKPSIFPNPVISQKFNIAGLSSENPIDVVIIGMDGKVYYSKQQFVGSSIELDNQLTKGLYVMRIVVGDQVFNERISVK
uniref:T9SS type A sorting domain-containing protein n=1 Tax=Fulvivirga sp. TaxID=1931237 RepID=UPI00404A5558